MSWSRPRREAVSLLLVLVMALEIVRHSLPVTRALMSHTGSLPSRFSISGTDSWSDQSPKHNVFLLGLSLTNVNLEPPAFFCLRKRVPSQMKFNLCRWIRFMRSGLRMSRRALMASESSSPLFLFASRQRSVICE